VAELIAAIFLPLPLALVAAVAHLDRAVLFQSLFHRPVFLAPLLGWMSGHLEAGVQVAMISEFVSLLVPPTGADIPADEGGLAAITMLTLVLLHLPEPACIPLVLAVTLSVLPVLRILEVLVRQGNERLARFAEAELLAGRGVPFKRLVFASMVSQILLYALLYLVAALVVGAVVAVMWYSSDSLRQWAGGGALFVVLLVPVVGVLRAGHDLRALTRYGLAAGAAGVGFLLGGI